MAKDKNSSKGKKLKKCSGYSRARLSFWYFTVASGFVARVLAALALAAIALKMHPLKQEAILFNVCIEETRNAGKSIPEAVRFCNGGGT